MKLNFKGNFESLQNGIDILVRQGIIEQSIDGFIVNVEQQYESGQQLQVCLSKGEYTIRFCKRVQFFRALSHILDHENSEDFEIDETGKFDVNGAMFDVSQGNSVINLAQYEKLFARMALMGLNMFMIYTEDNYIVEGEPYFGYMRGRYTHEDFKRCDDIADALGIEMIPCIQTLAHLIDALKWDCYKDIKEDDDTLLVGYEDTYILIEKLIKAASSPFRSKRIHIGMDEAWKLGQGEYLLKNGYRSKFEIMNEHIARVLEITRKYNLQPIIWSDVYFREAAKNNGHYQMNCPIPEEVSKRIPEGVALAYWDYYHKNEEFYLNLLEAHQNLNRTTIFAGGIWSWNSFTVDYEMTKVTTDCALNACKKRGIKEVFATVWGDGATESTLYSNLLGLQLFAEHGYYDEPDEKHLAKRFKACCGCNYEDFMAMSALDILPGIKIPTTTSTNSSKFLFWQDPLMGLFDKTVESIDLVSHYAGLTKKLENAINRNGEFGHVFEFLSRVSRVLEKKADIGIRITKYYKQNKKDILCRLISEEIPLLINQIEELRKYHRQLWHILNKPFGFEIMDLRYGALIARLDTTLWRINDWINGDIEGLEELDEERLPFDNREGAVMCLPYQRIVSASRIGFCMAF